MEEGGWPLSAAIERIQSNVAAIRDRMDATARRAGRDPAGIRLVGVTKTASVYEAQILRDLGVLDLAENRPEHARPKIEALGSVVRWHFIGNLQRRKARETVSLFHTVDAIDRVELGEAVQRRCEELGRNLDALIEINVSGEASKHGFAPLELPGALRDMRAFDRIRVQGLLTMAPWGAPEAEIRSAFRGLRELAHEHGLAELSMGMTDDFEIAIEEGATQIRIGRALFG